jgi:acyl-CoA synthetase (AMP-forming)/AMP-acid ligase II
MEKFDTGAWLALAESWRPTDVVLVPVQYRRLLDHPDFDQFDLSSFQNKFSTSAPMPAKTKAEILQRWPAGGFVEVYGMTEGGVGTTLRAQEHPDKLDTVGVPNPGVEMFVIDEAGQVLPQGKVGELVGRSPSMMSGYHRREKETAEASWFDEKGRRFQRSGDTGWFDADGYLHLLDRKKDVIISGGFNVYAIDLENVLMQHPDVAEAAVIAASSPEWGETPVAYVVLRGKMSAEAIRLWANEQLGKSQRISQVIATEELPRSPIGKILKRELRERFAKSGVMPK